MSGRRHRLLLAPGLSALALVILLVGSAAAKTDRATDTYSRDLTEVELDLRFAIELGPAELDQDIAFTEKLCLDAQTAEAASEYPTARVDWQGLSHVVRRNDRGVTGAIATTLRAAYRRVGKLDERFSKVWRGSPRTQTLREGTTAVRGGVLRLRVALGYFRVGFRHFLNHDCAGGEIAIEGAARPIRRGLVRVDSGMGLLWVLTELAGITD